MTRQASDAAWRTALTWGLCWLALAMGLIAWRVASLSVGQSTATILSLQRPTAVEPVLRIDASHALIYRGKAYGTLVEWAAEVDLPVSRPVVIEVEPAVQAQVLGRVTTWLQSRGVQRIIIQLASRSDESSDGNVSSENAGEGVAEEASE